MDWANIFQYISTTGLGNILSIIVIIYILKENTKREERLSNVIEKSLKFIDDDIGKFTMSLHDHDEKAKQIIHNVEQSSEQQQMQHIKIMEILNEMLNHLKELRRIEI